MRPLSVSSRVLSGNAASAIHGAAIALAAASPEHTRPASELARHLLETSWLRDASTWEPSGRFRRRSCCLIYRAAPDAASALCGDCILATR
jgi:FhuF-like iron-sulfur protein